jgi:uncharacterized integral membrane protein
MKYVALTAIILMAVVILGLAVINREPKQLRVIHNHETSSEPAEQPERPPGSK